MSEQYVSTIQLCEEVGMSRSTLDKLRRDGVLLPGREFYRLHGRRSPMRLSVDAVVQALRSRSALAETWIAPCLWRHHWIINSGYLHEHVHVQQHTGQRLVDIDGLQEKLQCICQWRPYSVFLRRCSSPVRSDTP